MTPDFFGEAFIPQSYIEKHYGSALVQFTEEVPELDQSVVILQRRPVGLTASLWQTAWPREYWRRLRSTPDERRRPEERSVLRTLLPRRLRLYARGEFRRLLRGALPEVLPGCLQGLEPRIAQGGGQPSQEPGLLSEGFFPHCPGSRSYFVPKTSERMEGATSRFPVPPQEFWLGWPTAEAYLDSGKQHVETMRQVLEQSGQPVELARCILEFGCAAGRLIRWLHDMADAREIWGLDIHAPQVMWCRQNLSPPFNFATTTIYPHLPFEDRYFDFAFAASVFTHIDDLAPAWFLELRRVLRPGGKLYVTVHDRNTVAILDRADHWLSRQLQSVPEYKQYAHAEFGMFTIGRSVHSQVFYDPAFLSRSLEPFFRTLSVTPNAYGYQTAVLLERV